MEMIGQDLVHYLRTMRTRLDFVAAHAEIWTLGDPVIQVLYLPRTNSSPPDVSTGLALHIKNLGMEEQVAALVYPDGRGKGYGLRRFNDDLRMEFTRLDGERDVHFTHARGFIAKTSASEPARLQALLKMAANLPLE